MKKLLKIKYLIIITSIFFGIQIHAGCLVRDNKSSKATCAKIVGAQLLRCAYLGSTAWHLLAAGVSAQKHLNDQQSSVGLLLKKIASGFLMEIASAYCSFYSWKGLSQYIKKLKGYKASHSDLADIPSEFNQEYLEDIDKVIFEVLVHCWIIASSAAFSYKTLETFKDAKALDVLKYVYLNQSSEVEVFSLKDTWTMRAAPISIPARIYTAYHSMKTICSKIKNLIISYKKELPKCALGNSNSSHEKNLLMKQYAN